MIRFRTGYSFRDAYGPIPEVLGRIEGPYAPITDRASSYGWTRWDAACKEAGKKPVFGVELAVSDDPTAKRPAFDYWTFYPLRGRLEDINHLIRLAYRHFRYRPLLPLADATGATGVLKVVGRRTPDEWLWDLFYKGYFALGPGLSKAAMRSYRKHGIRPALACDNAYPTEEGKGVYEIIAGKGAEAQTWPRHILSRAEIEAYLKGRGFDEGLIREAGHNAEWILELASTAGLRKASLPSPAKAERDLETLCEDGIARLFEEWTPEYDKRLHKELGLIHEKGYEDYFLIVADVCEWARKRMLVGPARGSSCGSLVCYLLGITSVDPIPHGLIFERFVDINRHDMPDIDIDFPEHRREEVIEYIRQSYGEGHVSRLGTVAVYRPRSALGEAGEALKVPALLTGPVLDAKIDRAAGDARATDTLFDTLEGIDVGRRLLEAHPDIIAATYMEGHPRHASTHASAVVLTDRPIEEYAPFNERDGTLMLDKRAAEELNILKIDVLGLTQLSILEDAMALAGRDYRELYDVPLDDEKALDVFRQRRFAGIFQFEGASIRNLASQVMVKGFEDLSSLTALGRPGPLASGGAREWVDRHTGFSHGEADPLLQEHLADTKGIVVYQEQVMQIGREVGGLGWGEVTALRKAVSKSLGKEVFDQFGDPWKAGAIAKGMDEHVANRVWHDLCSHGSYSFNKSHSVAYAIISYWCAWIKARWPVEFAAATLTHTADIDKQRALLREITEKEGVEFVPVDTERSGMTWQVDGNKVIGPLTNIHGIGEKTARSIVGARERGEKVTDAQRKKMRGGTELDSLYPVRDAYARLVPDPRARNIVSEPVRIEETGDMDKEEGVLVGIVTRISPRDGNEEVNVERRGKRIPEGEESRYLSLRVRDDTGEIICVVSRFNYLQVAPQIIQRGGAGKALYMLKGEFLVEEGAERASVMFVNRAKHLGEVS